ncbi:MAG: AAA domain-containing protein [Polyangia bacterium]|jgi:predicted RecB family nuclease|nr:AAA domain-containing protein [Polyangia bacterium]
MPKSKKTPRSRAARPGAPELPEPRFWTSPSRLGRCFFLGCERFLRFESTPRARREREGVPSASADRRPVTQAVLERGYSWEERVLRDHLGGQAIVATPKARKERTPLCERRHSLEESLELFARAPEGSYIYQATLRPPPAFYERLGMDPGIVQLRDNYPDLIQVVRSPGVRGRVGRRLLRVIDVKASAALKIPHRVQVALYALELQSILEASGIRADTDLDEGRVWLHETNEPAEFDLAMVVPHVERFLSEDLQRVLAKPAEEAAWHLYFHCEWCEYFNHCRAEAEAEKSVSLIPYLSPEAKASLCELGLGTLEELKGFLARPEARQALAGSVHLSGQHERLETAVEALLSGEPVRRAGSSVALPKGENIQLVLTAQREPATGQSYAFGFHAQMKRELRSQLCLEEPTQVFVARDLDSVGRNAASFLGALHDLLGRVASYNGLRSEWKDQLTLQAYTLDSFERRLLFELLLESLGDEDLCEQALSLLFTLQGAELLEAKEHPSGAPVLFPVVVVIDAIRQLVALPTPLVYRLPEILDALGAQGERPYVASPYLYSPLSNALRPDAIFDAWYKGRDDRVDWLEKELWHRMRATAGAIFGLRDLVGEDLVAWPPKFSRPDSWGIGDPWVSRMAFMLCHEGVARCRQIREQRALGCEERLERCLAIRGVARGPQKLVLDAEPQREVDTSDFATYIIAEDDQEGRILSLKLNDWAKRGWPPLWGSEPYLGSGKLAVAKLAGQKRDSRGAVKLELGQTWPKGFELRRGRRYLLSERFGDSLFTPAFEFMSKKESEGDLRFSSWLKEPIPPLPARLPPKVGKVLGKAPPDGLTKSQRRAFEAVLEDQLTLVWGPPGTGKTRFLAETILALLGAHGRAGARFRVLVSAFTHAAIENLMTALAALAESRPGPPLELVKVDKWTTAYEPGAVKVVDRKALARELDYFPLLCVGGTVHAFAKAKLPPDFDLVVIDEASQMLPSHALIPCSLAREEGRWLLAGDHRQLPPILQGEYPEPQPDEVNLGRSVFEVLAERPGGKERVEQLLENFRMNDVLTSFSRRLNGREFCCAAPEVGRRRLDWRAPRGCGELARCALDPDYPLVLVVLEGAFPSRESPEEAQVVADLVEALRRGLRDDSGRRYPGTMEGDAAFFRHGVFVVSPHHVQIEAIGIALAERRKWLAEPFVDTVDKMQGQQSEAVIVSYGVTDAEVALGEKEFIYSLNRLNVAVTRARSKCVVCLPAPLLDAGPRVLENDEASNGLAYMHALRAFCAAGGEAPLEFPLPGVEDGRILLHRARRTMGSGSA